MCCTRLPENTPQAFQICQIGIRIGICHTIIASSFYGPFSGATRVIEPVPEESFWTLWCKGRLTDADTPTSRLGVTPSGLTSGIPFGTIDMGQKGGGCCAPFRGERGAESSSNTMSPGLYLRTKWHLDPSNRLATIHQRYTEEG